MTKKRRSLFIVLGVVCVCVLSCAFVLTGCGNKHKFNDDWTCDETSHWHQCTKHDDDKDDVEDKAAHTWSEWEGTEATCTDAADRSRYCTVCGYTETDTGDALGHDFSVAGEVTKAATCTTAGSQTYGCSRCTEITTKEIPATGHAYAVTFGDWTEGEDGEYTPTVTVTCSNDSSERFEEDTDYTVNVTSEGGVYTATVKDMAGNVIGSDVYTTSGEGDVPGGNQPASPEDPENITIDFSDSESYSWIPTQSISYTNKSGNTTVYPAGIANDQKIEYGYITLASSAGTDAPMSIGTEKTGTLNTAGESKSESRYFKIAPSEYTGKYISITVEFVSNAGSSSSSQSRSLGITTSPKSPADSDPAFETSTSNSDTKTLSHSQLIEASTVLYITWTASVNISKITISITETDPNAESGGTEDPGTTEPKATGITLSGDELENNTLTLTQDENGQATGSITATVTMDTEGATYSGTLTVTAVTGVTFTQTPDTDGGITVGITVSNEATAGSYQITVSAEDDAQATFTLVIEAYEEAEPSRVAVTFDEDIIYGDENADYGAAVFENTANFSVSYNEQSGKWELSGNANVMGADQVSAWNKGNTYEGMAEIGDAYVVYGILLQPGETISEVKTEDGTWTYPEAEGSEADYYVFIIKVSAKNDLTYTVTTVGNGEITITIDFSGVVLPSTASDGAVEAAGSYVMISESGYTAPFENAEGFGVEYDEETGEFVLTGIANKMTEDQTQAFYNGNTEGHSEEDFIAYGIPLQSGDTIINLKTGHTETYAENGGLYFMVSHVTGNSGYYTYEIISSDGTITLVKVSFAGVVIANTATGNEITVNNATGGDTFGTELRNATFTNTEGFSYTYTDGEFVLSGKANVMTSEQATAFNGEDPEGEAVAGDYYIVIGIAIPENGKVVNLQTGFVDTYSEENTCYYMILRLTKTEGHSMFALVDKDDNVTLVKVTFADVDITWATGVNLTEGTVTGNNNEGVTFSNSEDLEATTTVDDDGNITITVTGTASKMSGDQASDFWAGHAGEGDAYIVVTVTFRANETVSWVSSAGDTRVRGITDYPDGTFDMVIRISGRDLSDEIKAGTLTFTIADSQGKAVNYTVDFSALINKRVVVATSGDNLEIQDGVSLGTQSLEIIESTNAEGETVYTLTGEASSMSTEIASWFGNGAKENDLYVVFKVYVEEGYTVSFGTTSGDKTFTNNTESNDFEDDGYIIIVWRLTGVTSTGAAVGTTEVTFTISCDGTTVETFVVAFDISNMPQGETEDAELPRVEISFTTEGTESYAWIDTVNGVIRSNKSYDGVVKSTPGSTTSDGLLTIVGTSGLTETDGAYSLSSAAMYIRSDKSNNLDTGGATGDGSRYFAINVSEAYVGKYLSVEVTFASTSSSEVRSVLLSSTQNVSEISATSIIAYASAGNAANTFSYVMQITEAGTLYIAWTGELLISAIKVEILENATPTSVPTGVTLSSNLTDGAYTVGTSSPVTVTATVTVENGSYTGGYTWDVSYSGDGSVFYFVENGDGTITITPVDAGTITVTYRCWDAAQVTGTIAITVTNPYTITLADDQSSINVTGSDNSDVTSSCTFTDSTNTVTVNTGGAVTAQSVEEETTVTLVVTLTESGTVIGEVKITLKPAAAGDKEP